LYIEEQTITVTDVKGKTFKGTVQGRQLHRCAGIRRADPETLGIGLLAVAKAGRCIRAAGKRRGKSVERRLCRNGRKAGIGGLLFLGNRLQNFLILPGKTRF